MGQHSSRQMGSLYEGGTYFVSLLARPVRTVLSAAWTLAVWVLVALAGTATDIVHNLSSPHGRVMTKVSPEQHATAAVVVGLAVLGLLLVLVWP